MAETRKDIKLQDISAVKPEYTTKIDQLIKANNAVVGMADGGKTAASIAKECGVPEATVKQILAGKAASVSQHDLDAIVMHKDAVAEKNKTPAQSIGEMTSILRRLNGD